MKKTKANKGITLVALIITIIVLLILAVVAIRAVQGDGILDYAKNAGTGYQQAQTNEQAVLEKYVEMIEPEKSSAKTIVEAQSDTMLSKTVNSKVTDMYGNKITVPAGFKILVDSTTVYTAENINVTEGIVIQDESGNEFVWVPVGTIYTNTDKTESKTITLGRYENFTATNGVYTPVASADTDIGGFRELTKAELSTYEYKNVPARSITDFVTSATTNGGYYIGRYEAGNSNNTLVCRSGVIIYYSVGQGGASMLSQQMYVDGYSSGTFSSDLANSYAWDTAIIFIQTFGTETDANTYADRCKRYPPLLYR